MAASEALQRAIQDAQAGRIEAALASVRMLAKRRPDDLEAIAVLGLLLMEAGQLDQAIHHLSRAVAMAPRLPGPRNNLANALVNARRHEEAERHWLAALEADPSYARAWLGLAIARTHRHDAAGAIDAAGRGLALQPDWPEMTRTQAQALAAADRAEDAVRALEAAAARHPGHAGLRSNLLMAVNYLERPADEIAAAHRGYAQCATAPPAPPQADRDPDRPLRIGILSGDLNTHAVGFFADAIFRHLPADRHLTAFATSTPRADDPMEAEFRRMAGAWCQANAMDDAALDRAIRERRIDVLVELGGHSSGGRLGALDRKPAPVIATAIGFPNTTGHPAVDVRIVDSVTDPVGSEAHCTERLARIDPCFLCYRPPGDAPEPAMPAPGEPVTFGSFNLLTKVSPGTLAAWRGALDACPGSRLLLKSRNFADPSACAGLLARAARAGIAPARIEIVAFTPGIAEHLALYRRVHVALDTFPYNGTTTTCEALWMGVPVVTLAGDRHAARVGASLLRAAGLPELVAPSAEVFAGTAAALAGDGARLAALRTGLRAQLRASPLLDDRAWAERFHGALREAWRVRCAR